MNISKSMAAPEPEPNPLKQSILSLMQECDAAMELASAAKIHQNLCDVIRTTVFHFNMSLVVMSRFLEFERPIRFILPFVSDALKLTQSTLNECSPLIPLLTSTDLPVRLENLESSLKELWNDVHWVEILVCNSYHIQRTVVNGRGRFLDHVSDRIDVNTAIAWSGIASLVLSSPSDTIARIQDLAILDCGNTKAVEEGAVFSLWFIVKQVGFSREIREACVRSITSLQAIRKMNNM